MEIEKVKKSLIDFANRVKNEKNWAMRYREKAKEIAGEVRKLKSRDSNLHLHRGEISDFEDEEFYGFSVILNRKVKAQTDL